MMFCYFENSQIQVSQLPLPLLFNKVSVSQIYHLLTKEMIFSVALL